MKRPPSLTGKQRRQLRALAHPSPSKSAPARCGGKQRRQLRALAHHLSPIVQVGARGLTDGLVAAVDRAPEDHELLEVRLGEGAPIDQKQAGPQLAERLGAHDVGLVGPVLILHRRHPDEPRVPLQTLRAILGPRTGGMAHSRASILLCCGALLLGACGGRDRRRSGGGTDGGTDPGGFECRGCVATPEGMPPWRPADMHVFTAPADGLEGLRATLESIVVPNHDVDDTNLRIGPGRSHDPPYDHELSGLVEAAGITARQTVYAPELMPPSGLWFMLTMVPEPGAETGSSYDFDDGPIIPNARLPMEIDCDHYKGSELVDGEFDSTYPGYDMFMPPLDLDGPSHFMLVWVTNSSFFGGVDPAGDHEFRCRFTDAMGAAWSVTIPFHVQGLPDVSECDHLGEHRAFDDAYEISDGSVEGRVCDFADMYLIGGEGRRRVTLYYDPAQGNLDLVNFDSNAAHDVLARSEELGPVERLVVPAGTFVQVYGVELAMGPYLLVVD